MWNSNVLTHFQMNRTKKFLTLVMAENKGGELHHFTHHWQIDFLTGRLNFLAVLKTTGYKKNIPKTLYTFIC